MKKLLKSYFFVHNERWLAVDGAVGKAVLYPRACDDACLCTPNRYRRASISTSHVLRQLEPSCFTINWRTSHEFESDSPKFKRLSACHTPHIVIFILYVYYRCMLYVIKYSEPRGDTVLRHRVLFTLHPRVRYNHILWNILGKKCRCYDL